ncbi:unnamed protein product [Mycena citricolor]|uniref:Uncharacterized protein n=1 Tax=Mycena citricolor TaxID=2018698 RepID=A0AAD2HXQ2_9AGAR|nr:unnamed protein product [Mycena citricolor]
MTEGKTSVRIRGALYCRAPYDGSLAADFYKATGGVPPFPLLNSHHSAPARIHLAHATYTFS